MTASSQKTATIAALVLSVLAFLQLAVVFVVLIRHPAPSGQIAQPSNFPGTTAASEKIVDSGKNSATSAGSTKSNPKTNEPAAGGAAIAEATVAPTEVDILVKRATDIREKGDMTGTLASLRDAQKLYPDDPKIVAEFAATYEQMGLVDKALAQWKRVMDAGDKAGDLYGVAAEKVRVGVAPKDALSGRDDEGLQPGSTLGFVDMQKNYTNPGGESEQVSLRMGIKARQNATVTASEVNIQAMFYDLIDNTEVQPTDPNNTSVTSEWITVPADWKDDGLEVLKVRYEQKAGGAGEKPASERKYLGYIMRVYYENELQDVIAEPVKLLQHFPPQVTLQKEIPQ